MLVFGSQFLKSGLFRSPFPLLMSQQPLFKFLLRMPQAAPARISHELSFRRPQRSHFWPLLRVLVPLGSASATGQSAAVTHQAQLAALQVST